MVKHADFEAVHEYKYIVNTKIQTLTVKMCEYNTLYSRVVLQPVPSANLEKLHNFHN